MGAAEGVAPLDGQSGQMGIGGEISRGTQILQDFVQPAEMSLRGQGDMEVRQG